MKKFLLSISLILTLCIGCDSTPIPTANNMTSMSTRMALVEKFDLGIGLGNWGYIVKDLNTNMEYLVVRCSEGIAITKLNQ